MVRKRIMSVLAGALLVGAAVVLPATSASASGEGVDMNETCQINYGAGWYAQLTYPSQGAYGWRCWVPPYGAVKKVVDVNAYCQALYGEWAYNTGGAYSWYCA